MRRARREARASPWHARRTFFTGSGPALSLLLRFRAWISAMSTTRMPDHSPLPFRIPPGNRSWRCFTGHCFLGLLRRRRHATPPPTRWILIAKAHGFHTARFPWKPSNRVSSTSFPIIGWRRRYRLGNASKSAAALHQSSPGTAGWWFTTALAKLGIPAMVCIVWTHALRLKKALDLADGMDSEPTCHFAPPAAPQIGCLWRKRNPPSRTKASKVRGCRLIFTARKAISTTLRTVIVGLASSCAGSRWVPNGSPL